MTLETFKLTEKNHFIAMEYYYLILNRTFLILLTKDYLIGIQGNGLVSIEGGDNILARELTATMAIKGDLTDPYSYLKNKYLEKASNLDFFDGSLIDANKTNFIIKRSDIKNVYHDPKKKWGMGYYPHDGKVFVETIKNKKREFIILGNQSGQDISNWLLTN